jgi:hypothetical protein
VLQRALTKGIYFGGMNFWPCDSYIVRALARLNLTYPFVIEKVDEIIKNDS